VTENIAAAVTITTAAVTASFVIYTTTVVEYNTPNVPSHQVKL